MSKIELKNCPFCDGEPLLREKYVAGVAVYAVGFCALHFMLWLFGVVM